MTTTRTTTGGRDSLWKKLLLHNWRGRFAWATALVVLTLVTCWLLVRATPSWYRPMDPRDQGVIDTMSRATLLVTTELNNAVQRVPLGEQHWSISQDEINCFLAADTAPPLNADGTPTALDAARNPITDPFVIFKKGQVTVAARYIKLPGDDPQGGVGSMTFSVGMARGADGSSMGLVKLLSVHAGYMPVPRSFVTSRMRAMAPTLATVATEAAQIQSNGHHSESSQVIIGQIIHSLVNGEPFPLRYNIDRKDVVIKEFVVEDGRFSLVLCPPALAAPGVPATASTVSRGN
jgi:hypothetical protein